MPKPTLRAYDLSVLAGNGLRRGRTTGTCATAAVKAALCLLLGEETHDTVAVTLPDGEHYLMVPIQAVRRLDAHTVRAEVLKDGGDDPDSTHGATIFAEVRRHDGAGIRWFAGRGVGTVTQPGLKLPPGEPAINPVPRRMMEQAVGEVLDELRGGAQEGFDLTIGCENGEAIARKTFNPRLGIVGGISILGTSGLVEPMSLASWVASIEVYIRAALSEQPQRVAYLPGKTGRDHARDALGLTERRTVQIANFMGDALDFTEQALRDEDYRLPELWLLGHPGKLAKVLDGVWDTHSSKSGMAMGSVAQVAREFGFDADTVTAIQHANTVEAALQDLRARADSRVFWEEVEHRIARRLQVRVPRVERVEVRLFDLHGNALGAVA